MSSALDITKSVNPPRAVFLDYPLGHTAGPPHSPDIQRRILIETLDIFATAKTPGYIKTLPFEWPENPDWKESSGMIKDDRLERFDTPQYQTDEDRFRFEDHDRSALSSCGCEKCCGL